jgi:hypothetical protein
MESMEKACQHQDHKFAGNDVNHLKARLYEALWIVDVRNPVKNPEHFWRIWPAILTAWLLPRAASRRQRQDVASPTKLPAENCSELY